MLNYSGSDSVSDNLPSFKQFCTSVSKDVEGTFYVVKFVWKPSLYPNFTLDTEKFRLRVPETSGLYSVLELSLPDLVESDSLLAISPTSLASRTFVLTTLDNERAIWEPLGTKGWKLAVQEKRSKKSRASKT